MYVKKGIPVSPGVAILKAIVLDAKDRRVPRRVIAAESVGRQEKRLDKAIERSIAELTALRQQTAETLGDELARIFSFHLGMLADPTLTDQFREKVRGERVTAEYAVYATFKKLADTFMGHGERYFSERVSDLWDLERRVLEHLAPSAGGDLANVSQPSVIIAHDLTPSQTAALDKTFIRALATEAGGRTSHTAILAHALGIPAVVGLETLCQKVSNGDTVIVDGNRGLIIVEPDASQLLEYRQAVNAFLKHESELAKLHDLPAVTKCGQTITMLGNIEFPSEIPMALEKGAEGVGLYRTEFLFLSSDHEPSEQQQYESYVEAIRALEGRPLTIRTLDLGADKIVNHMSIFGEGPGEPNPFLGCRSIRLCLQNPPLFRTQLRAILRASVEGPVKIMFPLISNVMELRQAKMILTEVEEDLEDQGVAFTKNIAVGMMIEVPSAALQARTFAKEADFFSLGTNDLIQYTVAVDRSNERIASLYSGAHPAVISLLKDVIRLGPRSRIEVSLCGEMAGQAEFTMLLLGLGLRTFSMTPPAIPEIKKLIRSVTIDQCIRVSRRVAGLDSDRAILNYLRSETDKIVPKTFDGRSIDY